MHALIQTHRKTLTSSLERSEQSLLCAEDLYSGCGVLGQIGERSSMGDEAGSDLDRRAKVVTVVSQCMISPYLLSNEGRERRGTRGHPVLDVLVQPLTVLREGSNTGCEPEKKRKYD